MRLLMHLFQMTDRHTSIYLRGFQFFMAEYRLDVSRIRAPLQHLRCHTVLEQVTRSRFLQVRLFTDSLTCQYRQR